MDLDHLTRNGPAESTNGGSGTGESQTYRTGTESLQTRTIAPDLSRGNTSTSWALSDRTLASLSSSASSLTPAEAASGRFEYPFQHRQEGAPPDNHDDYINCSYIAPVPTSKCLQAFTLVVGRLQNIEVQKRRQQAQKNQKHHIEALQKHSQTVKELREWRRKVDRSDSFRGMLKHHFRIIPHANLPSKGDILSMAKYYYPLRKEIKIYVCDFGADRFQKIDVPLGQIEEHLYNKPKWSDVRWIHAPLNAGLVHSSLEDRFLRGNRFLREDKSSMGWPYTSIETISLVNRGNVRDMLDVQQILRSEHPALSSIASQLDAETLDGLSDAFRHDLEWRAKHLGRSLTFWEMVGSDFARQLTGGSAEQHDSAITFQDGLEIEKQMLHSTPLYSNAQVVRAYFRCFQRADGFLLTATAGGGVDYIDRDLDQYLKLPSAAQADNEDGSMLGLLFEIFSQTGTSTWYRKNVDWLLVYILTEIAVKPTHIRNGCNAPSILRTYQAIVQDLKRKRYDQFRRKTSVDLVRDYLICLDELTTLSIIFKNTRTLLGQLHDQLNDVLKGERTLTPDNEHGESSMSRVLWAIQIVDDNALITKELLADLQDSLTALFQLRSIEQNELAIVADSQNKAILVFTGVTIIFLPLSFFTSYFGMNLQGIVDTQKSERYFWKLCGSLGFVLFIGIAFYAFKHRLRMRVETMKAQRIGPKGSLVV